MKQIELYVPKTDNQGIPIPSRHWENLRADLLTRFGGFTVYTATGQWIDTKQIPSETHTDSNVVYRVLTKDSKLAVHDIKKVALNVKRVWRQKTVLYTVSDVDVTYV